MDGTLDQQDLTAETEQARPAFHERRIGAVNWVGLRTLVEREVRRFLKVWMQTIIAPSVQALLFFVIFAVVLGGAGRVTGAIPFAQFLAPGLVMMAITQNAFQNTASSMIISKIQGTLVDLLMPPLSAGELVAGFVIGAVVRAAMVGALLILLFWALPLNAVVISHMWALLYFGVSAAVFTGLVGLLTGIFAEKFDHVATVTNFVIAPLTLLSGTFYSLGILKDRMAEAGWAQGQVEAFSAVLSFNPFFYVIDGFRYGFVGQADSPIAVGVILMLVLNVGLAGLALTLFKRGYRLKA